MTSTVLASTKMRQGGGFADKIEAAAFALINDNQQTTRILDYLMDRIGKKLRDQIRNDPAGVLKRLLGD